MEDLYLPPRSRKTLQQINQSEGIASFKILAKTHLREKILFPRKYEIYKNKSEFYI